MRNLITAALAAASILGLAPVAGAADAPLDVPSLDTTVTDDGSTYAVPALPDFTLPSSEPESVIGSDDRSQITNTTANPYRKIVKIQSSIGGCTGWMIGRNDVATAGHCVYDPGTGEWATNVSVRPAQDGADRPFGTCGSSGLKSVVGWTWYGMPDYDYGYIKLNCNVGDDTGWFSFFWQSASFDGQAARVTGYPGDKGGATMWHDNGTVRRSEGRRLFYDTDTAPGQSGAPTYHYRGSSASYCTGYCVIAIHAYGSGADWWTGYNSGTRITKEVNDNLRAWRAE